VNDAFIDPRRGLTAVTTLRLRAQWDPANLYLAIESGEPGDLEVMLQPDVTSREHRDLRIASAGATAGTLPVTAAVKISPRWRAELAVPLGPLTGTTPLGERWGLNVFRHAADHAIGAVWSKPLGMDVQAVDQCGDLIFVNEEGEDPSLAAEEDENDDENEDREHQRERHPPPRR
jgi:hypothetical protein